MYFKQNEKNNVIFNGVKKEKDVIVILDSLKDILKSKNLLTFFALP